MPNMARTQEGRDAAHEVAERFAGLDPCSVPDEVLDATKRYIVDCLGAAIAGAHAPGSAAILALASDWGGRPEATVWGSGEKVPAFLAGLANSQTARALDFDDVSGATFAHLTCSVLPAAMAMAEATGRRDGRALVASVAAGRDLICRLGLATGTVSTEGGRANMYQFNAFAVAAVAGMYLELSPEGILSALGLVYGQSLSSKQGLIEGAQVPRVHQGLATQLGIQCAYLAARALIGARGVFEGRFGYFTQYERNPFDRESLLGAIGERYYGLDSGIKKYPVCMQSHTAIDATVQVRAMLGDPPPSAISSIRVGMSSEAYHMVYDPIGHRRRPSTAAEVQYSLPWVVALAAAHGGLPLDHLEPDPVRDRHIAQLADLVEACVDADIDAQSAARFSPAWVEITLGDGRRGRAHVDVPPGSPGRELDWAGVEEKFRSCCSWTGDPVDHAAVHRQLSLLRSLEDVADVGQVASETARLAEPSLK